MSSLVCLLFLEQSHLLLAGGEVDSDPGCHGFGVSKEGVKAESVLFQVFPLDVAEVRLTKTNRGMFDYRLYLLIEWDFYRLLSWLHDKVIYEQKRQFKWDVAICNNDETDVV